MMKKTNLKDKEILWKAVARVTAKSKLVLKTLEKQKKKGDLRRGSNPEPWFRESYHLTTALLATLLS